MFTKVTYYYKDVKFTRIVNNVELFDLRKDERDGVIKKLKELNSWYAINRD